MKTIIWGNYKGGVGKTTSTFQVAKHLSKKGKKILLIDLDPQASLSNICSKDLNKNLKDVAVNKTLNFILEMYLRYMNNDDFYFNILENPEIYTKVGRFLEDALQEFKNEENLHYISTSISFANSRINDLAEKVSENYRGVFIIKLLLNDLKKLEEPYDYIFIDCPPTSNIITQSAFMSSDYYIIPTIIDEISADGVADYIAEIEKTRKKFEADKKLGGVIIDRVFNQKIQLIGVFETIYKERTGNTSNDDQIKQLDENINKIKEKDSKFIPLISNDKLNEIRYSDSVDGISTKYIFKSYIPNRDNRSGGESIPQNTANGLTTESYKQISDDILKVLS